MTALRTLLLLLGAFAVLTLGALSAPGTAEASTPPCHETSHDRGAPAGPAQPDKPMASMACCVACVTAVAPQPPVRSAITLPAPPRSAPPPLMPAGETLAPEPGPPRLKTA